MNSNHQNRALVAINVFSACCALVIFLITLRIIFESHWHGPFRDMWEIYPFLEKIANKTWSISDFWESYGFSHRLLIPKALYAADYYFSYANNHLLIVVSTLCQIAIVMIFLFSFKKNNIIKKGKIIIFTSALIIFQFSGSLLFNWLHTFDVQWFLCSALICFSLYLISIIVLGDDRRILVFGSMLLIASACLCNSSAMAAWPIWIYGITFKRGFTLKNISLIILILIFIFSYMSGSKTTIPEISSFLSLIKYIFYIFVYFPARYLTNPLSNHEYINVLYLPVFFYGFVFFLLIDFFIKKPAQDDFCETFLFFVIVFCIGVSIMTAIGRGYDPSHTKAMRYQNIVVLFWSATIVFSYLRIFSYKKIIQRFFMILMSSVLLGYLANQVIFWNENLKLGHQVNKAHLALMMGFSSNIPMIAPTVSRSMIYVPGYNLEKERYLHETIRKGIYSGVLAQYWLKIKDFNEITSQCSNVKWHISLYAGQYTSYTSLTITAPASGYVAGLMHNVNGRPIAAAVLEKPVTVYEMLKMDGGLFDRNVLKGYVIDSETPVDLVLLHHNGRSHCKILLR